MTATADEPTAPGAERRAAPTCYGPLGPEEPVAGKTLRLFRRADGLGGSWNVDNTGSDREAEIRDLFGSPILPTAFTTAMRVEDVVAHLYKHPDNTEYRSVIDSHEDDPAASAGGSSERSGDARGLIDPADFGEAR